MSEFSEFVRRLMRGADDVPFRDVIKAATGYEITGVDGELKQELLRLKKHFKSEIGHISSSVERAYRGRANELSNYMEKVVLREVNAVEGFHAAKPTMRSGKGQAAGYPDLFVKAGKRKFYLEVKTFQLKTKESSLRTFYYKPSESTKITTSCPHLVIGFEVESLGKDNRSPFRIVGVKLLDLYKLKVSLKPEFNASNVGLYACDEI